MKNEKLEFLSELLSEGLITSAEFDRILSRKFKVSEILEVLSMDKEHKFEWRPSLLESELHRYIL